MGEFQDTAISAMQMVMGADMSIDLLACVDGNLDPISGYFPLEDLFAVADRRLRLRSVLSLGDSVASSQVAQTEVESSRLQALTQGGWPLRLLVTPLDASFLIVDGEQAFTWAPGPAGMPPVFEFNRMPGDVARLEDLFIAAWEAATDPETLYASAGLPERLEVVATEFWNELITKLAANPDLMHELDARRFEELTAELLHREGLDVELTPRTRDGGRDVIASASSVLGDQLFYVECKRYAPHRPVGVEVVRQLFGVVEQERATAGIVVTTSGFSREATAFRERVAARMTLREYRDLVDWIRRTSCGI